MLNNLFFGKVLKKMSSAQLFTGKHSKEIACVFFVFVVMYLLNPNNANYVIDKYCSLLLLKLYPQLYSKLLTSSLANIKNLATQ